MGTNQVFYVKKTKKICIYAKNVVSLQPKQYYDESNAKTVIPPFPQSDPVWIDWHFLCGIGF